MVIKIFFLLQKDAFLCFYFEFLHLCLGLVLN